MMALAVALIVIGSFLAFGGFVWVMVQYSDMEPATSSWIVFIIGVMAILIGAILIDLGI